ncbi:MAG: glycosyltransferase family 4 protein [Methylacidiphilales bacterium]|nr:glycosyltransferase family 4 protein [Candidatus Methylacidiphilales bacterium]
MRLALLSTDDRENRRCYSAEYPIVPTPQTALLQGLGKHHDWEVHFISCLQQPVNAPKKLGDNIWYHALQVPKIGWMRTGYQGCIRAVRRKLREIGPDIVHGQGTERDCGICAVFSGYPNVLTIHGNMAALARQFRARPGSYLWLTGFLENFTVPRTGGVLCNSAYTEELVSTRNRRTWRVPNPVREAFWGPARARRTGDRPRLVNVGVIGPRKRQLEILAMFKRLHEQGHGFQIEFIGHVDEHEKYGQAFLDAIRHATEQGYGIYSGTKDIDPLIAALDQADGCIHFPLEEAFGLVVVETLARNLKFFGARVGGIVDIAESVEGAELFPAEDWSGLEEGLRRWKQAGCPRPENAAQVMAKRYHPRVIAEKHLEIYREVISSRRQG